MQPDAILFQAAEQPFFAGETRAKDLFFQNHEKYCGRDGAAPEALSENLAKGIASENNAFSFTRSTRVREKRFNAAWKRIASEPLNVELP
ncbi:hypothetical protein KSC_023910 [Ktedonobacter sp. SOSP1-52]|uniref:hypothetical protein n=1 Tax=Ktedonobacter sp. SOSP1-52 TaxID=2778366 RepID=UPI001915FF58|nr:hypothetical protein [Ktedonobacter sp. SOSP1-52]GHO63499.1 hypothetical protein KSC_023910 [Ktedonobacter sp. SOSP1-52]